MAHARTADGGCHDWLGVVGALEKELVGGGGSCMGWLAEQGGVWVGIPAMVANGGHACQAG
jgi:hypothetical protein